MGAIMNELAKIADEMTLETGVPEVPFRMADFGSFGYRVFDAAGLQPQEWIEILNRLQRAQATFATEGDGVVEALRILLASNNGRLGSMEVGELYKQCRKVAALGDLAFPDSVQAFGRSLTNMRPMFELELNVRFIERTGHAGKRWIGLIPRNGDAGGDGDDIQEMTINAEKIIDAPEKASPLSPSSPGGGLARRRVPGAATAPALPPKSTRRVRRS